MLNGWTTFRPRRRPFTSRKQRARAAGAAASRISRLAVIWPLRWGRSMRPEGCIADIPDNRIVTVSSFYRTPPLGPQDPAGLPERRGGAGYRPRPRRIA